jgi:asparagine synthase (glutamine-hydrolysing)
VRVQRYWETVYPTSATLAREERSDAEIIKGFRAVLDDAVAERLTADVEVACYLSGGLDSSAVLGLAQSRLDRPIRAFTIAFEGAFDESPLAQRTAAFTGSKHIPVPVTPQVLADALEDTVWHCERPIINANCAAKFLLSRAVRDAGIKVVFTGEGSDEMLAGYMWERRDLMLYSRQYETDADRQAALAAMIAANPLTAPFMLRPDAPAARTRIIRDGIGFCPSWIECFAAHYGVMSELMRPDAPGIDTLDLPYHAILSELDIAGRIRGRDPVNTSLYMWQRTMLINYILTGIGDRMEMAHSVEGRLPYLDHHVSEYAASLPVHYKVRESTEKYVLREATRDVITPELHARPKFPFIAPPLRKAAKNAKRDPLQERCEDIIRSRSFSDQPFFDRAKACAYLDSLTDADNVRAEQASPIVLQLATFSLLQTQFSVSS